MVEIAGSRQERKQRTRQALLDGALRLLADRSLSSLSLREVTREVGIVPTAFYRHFASMADLGVALVEESMRTLRRMIRQARSTVTTNAIKGSVATLVQQVHSHDSHFRFIVRERYGGVAEVRRAIATELRLFASELATDLGRLRGMTDWTTEDLRIAADLMVGAMFSIVLSLLESDTRSAEAGKETVHIAECQLRLIALGMGQWRSKPSAQL
ncbi:MAG TPA: TetR family transcriptional regulator [Pseudonocardiaceae bacterium]|jgi:AcrR family transcriptional regulator|nr:TetR family transcriptional regulator [Pseudonocardiaceae bacterium]